MTENCTISLNQNDKVILDLTMTLKSKYGTVWKDSPTISKAITSGMLKLKVQCSNHSSAKFYFAEINKVIHVPENLNQILFTNNGWIKRGETYEKNIFVVRKP